MDKLISKSRELWILPHLPEGLWNIGGVIADSGRLFERYRRLTGQDRRSCEETLEELIVSDGTLPRDKAAVFPGLGFFGDGTPRMLGRGAYSTSSAAAGFRRTRQKRPMESSES